MRISELKPYSIGIVASNKPLNTNIVDVSPIEDAPFINGELTADTEEVTLETTDQLGSSSQVSLTSANTVKAEWLPLGSSNRRTAPDVRRGESVVLYRFADADKFYWTTLKDDMRLRKLETVIYAFSGTKQENANVNEDNYYYLELSTHRKLIHFHTSKANGELFGYDIQINPGEGFIKIQDDAGNFVILDSKEKQIALKNTDGCYLDINKKNATLNVPETLTINAKNFVEKIAQSLVTQATTVYTEASDKIMQQGSSIVVQGNDTVAISSPATTIV